MEMVSTTNTATANIAEQACVPAQQRRTPRVELNVEIGLDDHTNFYVGFAENVSEGGLFVATYKLRPVGTEIALTFVLPNDCAVQVQGVVRWVRDPRDLAASDVPPGMGIEFKDVGTEDRLRIEAYVRAHAPIFYPD
jgi:uncharacterized protein (TIGR02266 family)